MRLCGGGCINRTWGVKFLSGGGVPPDAVGSLPTRRGGGNGACGGCAADEWPQIPGHRGVVAASGDQQRAVRGEGQTADEARVAAEAVDKFATAAVPELHGAVLTARGDPTALPVGTECAGVNVAA